MKYYIRIVITIVQIQKKAKRLYESTQKNRTGAAMNCMFPVSTEYFTKTVLKDGPPQIYTNYRNLYRGNYN